MNLAGAKTWAERSGSFLQSRYNEIQSPADAIMDCDSAATVAKLCFELFTRVSVWTVKEGIRFLAHVCVCVSKPLTELDDLGVDVRNVSSSSR